MRIRYSWLLFLFLSISLSLHAQKEPLKFGKVTVDQVRRKSYPIDLNAEAIILRDFGKSWFERNNVSENFQYHFERTVRIKILKKEGYKWADGSVAFYKSKDGSQEKVVNLKGITYNITNGKFTLSKLDKSGIFEEKTSENWHKLKFKLPDVKEGSVIEYTYHIVSDYISEFRPWNFQHQIPILKSEYWARIPEWYEYRQIKQGVIPFKTSSEKKPEEFKIVYNADLTTLGDGKSGIEKRSFVIESLSTNYRWYAEFLPAMKAEPYTSNLQNYFTRIELMLSSIQYPRSPVSRYATTYPTYNQSLLESVSFGKQLQGGGFLKSEIKTLKSKYSDPGGLMAGIYNHIRDHMVWNENYGKRSRNIRGAYKEGKGSVADINLLLVLMLREAGLEADPVILATRGGNQLHPEYPIDSRFNYVIARVDLGNGVFLLDATDDFRPFYILPERVLSGKGWVVSPLNYGFVYLRNKETLTNRTKVMVKLEEGKMAGKVSITEQSMAAYHSMRYKDNEKEEKLSELPNSSEWQISDFNVTSDREKAINFTHDFNIELESFDQSNILYINPVIFSSLPENPFKLDKRNFPVNYPCPESNTYMFSLDIPKGYVIEELPQNGGFGLPNKGGIFRYAVNKTENNISVIIQHKINQKEFEPYEYSALREFYMKVVSKCSEQIVLKRKS